MRGIRRSFCNRSFILGALLAYGTVLLFFVANVSTPWSASVRLRHRYDISYSGRARTPGYVRTSARELVPDVDPEEVHRKYANSNNPKESRVLDLLFGSSPVNDVVDNAGPGKTTTALNSVKAASYGFNHTQVGEMPSIENNAGSSKGSSNREAKNLTNQPNRPTPAAEVHCIKSKENRKYDPSLDCRRRLPHVIGIGVEKCGSGALSFFLRMHPHVEHSTPKELYYWNKHANESLEWYRKLMPMSSKYQVSMEFTPSYIFGRDIPGLIKEHLPDTKFIVMLRDPIQRAVSQYLHVNYYHWEGVDDYKPLEPGQAAHAFVNDTFETTVVTGEGDILDGNAIVENGLYDVHLQRWFDVFPRDRFMVVDEGEFSKDPLPSLRKVEAFLDLPPFFNEDMIYFDEKRGLFCRAWPTRLCLSSTKGRPHPDVRDDVLKRLTDYYRPYNQRLNSLLRQNFSWTY